PLTMSQIRSLVMQSARHDPVPGIDWHSRYGVGRVDALATVLTQFPSTPTPIAPTPTDAVLGSTDGASGDALPIAGLVESLASAATRLRSRVRIQIEVEPIPERPASRNPG